MRISGAVALSAVLCASSSTALAEKALCPKHETGGGYPWQTQQIMDGDEWAWVYVDVDKGGRPIKCGIGQNNIPDPEVRFRLCSAYSEDWRTRPAAEGEPATRTIKRMTVLTGYKHQMADQQARKRFFREHPEERPECYPD